MLLSSGGGDGGGAGAGAGKDGAVRRDQKKDARMNDSFPEL